MGTFLTDNVDVADKSSRLAAMNQTDPEDALKTPAQLQAERADLSFMENVPTKKHAANDDTEDHWSAVLKRLAPAGYSKSPVWQQRIIEKVFKTMTKRQKEAGGSHLSKEQMAHTIDLAAIGLSAEMAAAIRAEDQRVAATMRELPKFDAGNKSDEAAEPSNLAKAMAERQNKVHFYTRAIQMEQLMEQDLESDLKQIMEEMASEQADRDSGQAKALETRFKVERQLKSIHKRSESLTVKASEVTAENAVVRLKIDELRREKVGHHQLLAKMRAKAAKMDEDIAFLTQSTHSALDQREKVKTKFLAAQRDAQQEREQKLAIIKELIHRATTLDNDWGLRQAEIELAQENRRRKSYVSSRKRRADLEAAEVQLGFLVNQVKGWSGEFDRLQTFTGMETKFEPGEPHIVHEITSRFKDKERANTSLLAYQGEQQLEMSRLTDETREVTARLEQLRALIAGKGTHDADKDKSIDELEALKQEEDEKSEALIEQLQSAAAYFHAISQSLWSDGEVPIQQECSPLTIDMWLRAIEQRVLQIHTACSAMSDDQGMAPILTEWVKPKTKKLMATVPEIHEALLAQAAQQKKGGTDLEEEDEEEAERVKVSQKSPFVPIKVNKAKERQQIIEWARKRQGHMRNTPQADLSKIDRASRRAESSFASDGSASPLKCSASAPAVGRKPPPPPSHLPPITAGAPPSDSPQATAEGAAWYTAQHGADPPQGSGAAAASAARPRRARTPTEIATSPAAAAAAPAACGLAAAHSAPALHADTPGALPRIPSADRSNPQRSARKARGGGGSRSAATASGPPPKDLGTMIYLLGTQSSSMNARRLAHAAGPSH
ncbi:hypothetical protein AB1Y20_019603 [Prymnesium parvum]|uniref:ODAD1 central coiled coil region domain-containing protein n=1 Tax=Prymnesium parvum TaxID=97485 RepID=A0AB34JST9_PRYPA